MEKGMLILFGVLLCIFLARAEMPSIVIDIRNVSELNNDLNFGSGSSYNVTYDLYAYNQTIGAINDVNNRFWNRTQSYNITQIENNFTLFLLKTDQIFNETNLLNSINTTSNIMALGFLNSSQINQNFSLYLLLTDQRFNETNLINAINSTINIMNLGFYNKTQIDSNMSLYLLLTDQRYNNTVMITTVNSSLTTQIGRIDNINSTIQNNNASWISTYNQTYANYVNANISNFSTYSLNATWWYGFNTTNSTQIQNNNGTLNLNLTWLDSIYQKISNLVSYVGNWSQDKPNYYNISQTYNRSQIDQNFSLYILLTDQRFNDTNLINSINSTVNIQNLGFYNKTQVDNNLSLYLLLTDQRFNETSVIQAMNSSWLSTYNYTYATWSYNQTVGAINDVNNRFWNITQTYNRTQIDNNLSLYLLLTDQRFNETSLVNSINSTINIMNLGFYNKTQIDNNLSLYLLLTDQRYNETTKINSINTTLNIQTLGFYNITQIDNNFSLYYLKNNPNNYLNYTNFNTTQFTNANGKISVLDSWITSFGYITSSALSPYAQISNLVSYLGNWSADKINYPNWTQVNNTFALNISLYSVNQTINNNNASWSSTFNSTYDSYVKNNVSNYSYYLNGYQYSSFCFANGTNSSGQNCSIQKTNLSQYTNDLPSSTNYYPSKINLTTITYTGNLTNGSYNGYMAGNIICNLTFAGSHMCDQSEVSQWFAKAINPTVNGDAWVIAWSPKYIPATVPVSDCNGFTYQGTTNYLGNYMHFNSTTGGDFRALNCGSSLSLACCTY